ncbi:YecA family protein [Neobacillus cucumis]|uniref:Zinc chelation protein SecC n=1 Tax=Neobacillus cucumis TaxID=1740721 RepID=A0A2N5H8L9_9BACI|nr:SEC-C metal-binding domain-containing protein [Neobacillus cucumis]PLS01850.1 zinc chelation protein SecC [Neobacillus cucumis]
MTFLEKIKPHLISKDPIIQETVLHALHDYPCVPEDWTVELLKEAFQNMSKLTSILIYVENQTFNEEAVKILLENIPMMDPARVHLAMNLIDRISPELALKCRGQLEKYISKETWTLYELIVNGTEEEVYKEYGGTLFDLDHAKSFNHPLFTKAKKLAACIVRNGWVTEREIDLIIKDELEEDWFSFNGILTVYMIGLLKLEKYISTLASLLNRDDDVLLEEAAFALIGFQSNEVVKEVAPYLRKTESIIFASSVVENVKTDFAIQVLREAYHDAEELDDQDLLFEALCHQLSKDVLTEISDHLEKEYTSNLVDVEQAAYGYYSILGEQHPELKFWRQSVLERELEMNQASMQVTVPQVKVGRNDPCPCESGKKYKKCCGK